MYMLYTVIGSLFLIMFGAQIAYDVLWANDDEEWTETEPLEGHPITYNLTGHIVPIVSWYVYYSNVFENLFKTSIFFNRVKWMSTVTNLLSQRKRHLK